MASRSMQVPLLAGGCVAAAWVLAAPGFVPLPPAAPSAGAALGVQRLQAQPSAAGSSRSTFAAAAAGALASVAAVAGLARRAEVARQSERRELAIAYQDSGIELLDNGKFAQGLLGAEGAWGRYEFDPAGLTKYTELMPYARESELKHGRVAMLAWLGLVVPDFVRIPGDRYSFEAVPVTIDAHDAFASAVGANFQILFWISLVELCSCKKVFEWNSLEVAGDYGLVQLFWPKDAEGQKKMRISELKNGRLAMVAFGGAITQAVITRHPFPWLY